MFGWFKKTYPAVDLGQQLGRAEVSAFPRQKKVSLSWPGDDLELLACCFVEGHIAYYNGTHLREPFERGVLAYLDQPGPTWPITDDVQPENYVSRNAFWFEGGSGGFGGALGGPADSDAAILEATKSLLAATGDERPSERVAAAVRHLIEFAAADGATLPTAHKKQAARVHEALRRADAEA